MAIVFHSYEIYIFMMSIKAPWFCIMIGRVFELFSCLDVRITTFKLEKTTFVVWLIVLSHLIVLFMFETFFVQICTMLSIPMVSMYLGCKQYKMNNLITLSKLE
jgi:hypothetical protein